MLVGNRWTKKQHLNSNLSGPWGASAPWLRWVEPSIAHSHIVLKATQGKSTSGIATTLTNSKSMPTFRSQHPYLKSCLERRCKLLSQVKTLTMFPQLDNALSQSKQTV